MTKLMKRAFEEAERLPEAAQEHLAKQILDYLEREKTLRAAIQVGLDDIAAGRVTEVKAGEVTATLATIRATRRDARR